jgi:chromosome segregation ATPase
MIVRFLFTASITLIFTVSISAQTQSAGPQMYAADPMANISMEMTRVSRNVEDLTKQLKEFVDKFEKVGGITFNEKQQRLVLGMEMLVRAEQRITAWQKYQIELVEKQGEVRAKLAGIEIELRPERIDRSVQFEGTTRTEELRESRRTTLQAERQSLTSLMSQIDNSLREANDALRESQSLATRLRRLFLPQIEQELYER